MSEPLEATRAGIGEAPAWIVGGAVRDRLLGRDTTDLDIAVAGDPEPAARAIARAAGGTAFELSEAFGAWRVVARGHAWHVDLVRLRDDDVATDLAARDFTVNAMAEPLGGGELVDPHGGRADLEARRVRMVSAGGARGRPAADAAAVRLANELELDDRPATAAAVRERAPELARVAAERVFQELKRIVAGDRPVAGLELMDDLGRSPRAARARALRGVEQNVFHHRDVHGHTLEVLEAVAHLETGPPELGEHAEAVRGLLPEPLADELTAAARMRFAALLHDVAKPATRGSARRARHVRRPRRRGRPARARHPGPPARSQRLADYVAALTRHHLRLGFLVHERPLSRRSVRRYLVATDPRRRRHGLHGRRPARHPRARTPSRDRRPPRAGARDARPAWSAAPRRAEPIVRGDELTRELGVRGPQIGRLLAELEEAQYAGEIRTREDALSLARSLLS